MRSSLKSLGRAALWPVRRFVDPRIAGLLQYLEARFEHLNRRIDSLEGAAFGGLAADAAAEATTLMGQSLADLIAHSEQTSERLQGLSGRGEQLTAEVERLATELGQLATEVSGLRSTYFERLFEGSVDNLDDEAARLLNSAFGHRGFAAQRGLWFNPPVSIRHSKGDVEVAAVNERIVEVPYVFRAVGRLPSGSTILDVGAAESTLSLSLATLGYRIVALDPRRYPLSHPRLQSVDARIEEWSHRAAFDAIVCLSTIEHIGLESYQQRSNPPDADLVAMRRMHELTKPGGMLVLTTSFGRARVDSFARTYDQAGLNALLEGWIVEDMTIAERTSPVCWDLEDAEGASDSDEKVVLVTATRPK